MVPPMISIDISIINIHKPYLAELETKLANDLGPYISAGMTPDIFSFGHASCWARLTF